MRQRPAASLTGDHLPLDAAKTLTETKRAVREMRHWGHRAMTPPCESCLRLMASLEMLNPSSSKTIFMASTIAAADSTGRTPPPYNRLLQDQMSLLLSSPRQQEHRPSLPPTQQGEHYRRFNRPNKCRHRRSSCPCKLTIDNTTTDATGHHRSRRLRSSRSSGSISTGRCPHRLSGGNTTADAAGHRKCKRRRSSGPSSSEGKGRCLR